MKLALVFALLISPLLQAQESAPRCEQGMIAGRLLAESGQLEQALRVFRDAAEAAPDCSHENELAVDWLGRMLLARGDAQSALSTWERAIGRLTEQTWALGGDEMIGAYLEALVLSGLANEPRASVAFDLLLRPSTGQPRDRQAYARMLAQVASVVPDSVRHMGFVGGQWQRGVAQGGGLARWWVGEDPFPATGPNERIQEHLQRVAIALADYGDPRQPPGYDERGDLIVRFGAPQAAFRLSFDESDLLQVMVDMNVGVTPASFHDNEVWVYPDQPEPRTYVLVEQAGTYAVGRIEDLFPATLRRVTGLGERRENLQRLSLLAMQYAYGKLATLSLDYGAAWSSASAALDQMASPIAPGRSLARGTQERASRRELEYAERRVEREPPSVGRVTEGIPPVPFAKSTARFRDEAGRTHLRLAWQYTGEPVESAALAGTVVCAPRSPERTIEATLVQSTPERATETHIGCTSEPTRPTTLAVQLDLFGRSPDGALGERLATSVWDVDTVQPLRTTGLEMSDLWPIDGSQEAPLAGRPVEPGTPLSIYFEGYGFEGRLDRSRVVVEYEVVRRRNGSLLRRTRETATSSTLQLFLRGTQTEQFVILDTADWEGADAVDVRVTMRDARAGTAVERTIAFEVDS